MNVGKAFVSIKVALSSSANTERVINWNDDPERTHAEVVELLKKANV